MYSDMFVTDSGKRYFIHGKPINHPSPFIKRLEFTLDSPDGQKIFRISIDEEAANVLLGSFEPSVVYEYLWNRGAEILKATAEFVELGSAEYFLTMNGKLALPSA